MTTSKIQTAFWISREDKAAFEKAAQRDGISLTAWITQACHEKVRRIRREQNR